MTKYTQKWKSLNKKGLQLSLICGLNWLIGFVAKSQFYLLSATFLGFLTYGIPQEDRRIAVNIIIFLIIVKLILDCLMLVIKEEFKRFWTTLVSLIYLVFFAKGATYIEHQSLGNEIVYQLIHVYLGSFVIFLLVAYLQPALFKYYLFKNVINKEYLGIRKISDALPPESNLYTDADENDADKRMRQINQNVIKPAYQEVVELSYLNREVITAIQHHLVGSKEKNRRIFVDDDTIYYPIFTVHPFGCYEGKLDFCHRLIQFRISQKSAFLTIGEGLLKKDF